jgi:DNA-binding GntR family transcriptional regulator
MRNMPRPPALGQHAVKLDRSVYSGRVTSLLREAIVSGELAADAPLVEARLAEQLSVSRGPIRNALHALESEGLVRTQPNGRTVVVGFGPADFDDLMRVRLELESAAIRRGIEQHAEIGPLEATFAEMEQEQESTQRLVDLDVIFHRRLVELSGSRFLTQSWLALAPVIHTVITIGNRRLTERDPAEHLVRIIGAHRPLVAAVAARDTERALRVLAEQFGVTTSMFGGSPS